MNKQNAADNLIFGRNPVKEALKAGRVSAIYISDTFNDKSVLDLVKYTIYHEFKTHTVFDSIPCTFCPVFGECQSSNIVNASDCPHMENFLQIH